MLGMQIVYALDMSICALHGLFGLFKLYDIFGRLYPNNWARTFDRVRAINAQ